MVHKCPFKIVVFCPENNVENVFLGKKVSMCLRASLNSVAISVVYAEWMSRKWKEGKRHTWKIEICTPLQDVAIPRYPKEEKNYSVRTRAPTLDHTAPNRRGEREVRKGFPLDLGDTIYVTRPMCRQRSRPPTADIYGPRWHRRESKKAKKYLLNLLHVFLSSVYMFSSKNCCLVACMAWEMLIGHFSYCHDDSICSLQQRYNTRIKSEMFYFSGTSNRR